MVSATDRFRTRSQTCSLLKHPFAARQLDLGMIIKIWHKIERKSNVFRLVRLLVRLGLDSLAVENLEWLYVASTAMRPLVK